MAGRNPAWDRDELILALDLYFEVGPNTVSASDTRILDLSNVLRALPTHSERPDPTRFRNSNSVYMKLGNFLRFERPGHGLDRGGQLEEVVWQEYSQDRARLRKVASAIRATIAACTVGVITLPLLGEDEEATEGRLLLRLHRQRERNRSLVARKKDQALEQFGALRCEACGFDSREVYGELGEGFIECHHRTALANLRPDQKTRLVDLALVCANCHRMLHRNGDVRTVDTLRALIASHATPGTPTNRSPAIPPGHLSTSGRR